MDRRQISTNVEAVSCDVCGRTMLRGEKAGVFIFAGSRRRVCDLCTVRAAHDGWIREGVDDVTLADADGRRRESLFGRLRARRADADRLKPGGAAEIFDRIGTDAAPGGGESPAQAGAAPAQPSGGEAETGDGDRAQAPSRGDDESAPTGRQLADEHRAAREVMARSTAQEVLYDERTVRGVPSNSELKVARAIELFNASPHARTVTGVARSLGKPLVCARPSMTEGSVVTVVVAWELSWYRYEIDLGDEAAGVRVVAHGSELDELDPADREPNGRLGRDGHLHQASPVV